MELAIEEVAAAGAAHVEPAFIRGYVDFDEGMFTDSNGDPANATITLGIPGQTSTANAITILGATATIRQYRWDGSKWVE